MLAVKYKGKASVYYIGYQQAVIILPYKVISLNAKKWPALIG